MSNPIKCPKCDNEFHVALNAVVPKEQTITMQLKLATEMVAAGTVGKTIVNFEKLQTGIAKQLGAKIQVFIKEISLKDKVLEIQFCIINATKETPARSAPNEPK